MDFIKSSIPIQCKINILSLIDYDDFNISYNHDSGGRTGENLRQVYKLFFFTSYCH